MIEKYRPSNGTEGEVFFESWCSHCQRDLAMSKGLAIDECGDDDLCDILGRTMALDVDDPGYPEEWQYDDNRRPCCTAFVPAGESVPERCLHTADMFGEA